MKQKREDFRQVIRRQANEKIFTQVRQLISKQTQQRNVMQTSEMEFFQELATLLKQEDNVKQLLKLFKKQWEPHYDKKQLTGILFDPETKYFDALISNFKISKHYLRLLIYMFTSLETDLPNVQNVIYKSELIQRLIQNFKLEEQIIQQQILCFLSVLVQYSQLYRISIKNSGIIDDVVHQIVEIGLPNLSQNYIECFLFLIWSLMSPDITQMSELLERIYESLLKLNEAIQNFTSDYLLSIIFRGASKFSFCREMMFQYDQASFYLPLLNPKINTVILIDFLDFLNELLVQETVVFSLFFPKFCWKIIGTLLQQQWVNVEVKIRSVYLIIETFNIPKLSEFLEEQYLLSIILQELPNVQSYDLIQAYFTLLQQFLIQYPKVNDDLIEDIASSIVNATTVIMEVQLLSVWQIVLFLIQETEFATPLITYLKQKNFPHIAECGINYSKSSITTHTISKCIDLCQ